MDKGTLKAKTRAPATNACLPAIHKQKARTFIYLSHKASLRTRLRQLYVSLCVWQYKLSAFVSESIRPTAQVRLG